jgi:KDO2-lipid IV(A) lauroyltransferase
MAGRRVTTLAIHPEVGGRTVARKRSLVVQYLVYLAVRLLICLARMMPVREVLALAGPLAWLAYLMNVRHRLVAKENIRHAFPEYSEVEVDALVRRCYRHFVEVMIEVALLSGVIRRGNVGDHFGYPDEASRERFEGAIFSGRPCIFLTGHLGNWEVMGYSMGLMGIHAHIVARRLDNPFLDVFIRDLRCMTGQQIIDKDGAYPHMRRALKAGERVAIVGDQDAGEKGLFVDFLGRPASTFKPTAHLSLTHNVPIVVVATVRVGPMRFVMRVADVIEPREYRGRPDAVLEVTRRYSAALEALVRQTPEQYFWLHRRWKHRPPGERVAA